MGPREDRMKYKNFVIATGITAFILGGALVIGNQPTSKSDCVGVYIDYGVLSKKTPDWMCLAIDKKTKATAVFSRLTLDIDYIDFGGDLGKAVCAVNKLPKNSCDEMDWKSYWGVFVERGQNNLNPDSHWNMAQTGVSFIELNPGDGIALVYLDKGKIRYPE